MIDTVSLAGALALAAFSSPGATQENCSVVDRLATEGLERELEIVNSADRKAAYAAYIASFDTDARVYRLVPGRPATLDDVAEHYRAVFFELGGGTLVEDEVYTAGPMAAHRYHSMLTLNGTFDGVEARDKQVILRGQTFFHFGKDGRIIERWSNHDHAYRMEQLLGEKGRIEGEELGEQLNGPGLTEADGYRFVDAFAANFSRAESPELRKQSIANQLAEDVTIHGLGCSPVSKRHLLGHLDDLWSAFPDLFMTIVGTPASGWSMIAFRWKAIGSQRKAFGDWRLEGRAAAEWRGEVIMKLGEDGRATEIWWNEQPLVIQSFNQ
ncbi:MAG: hypothetical protein EP350_01725 [Alphaproteobacteria bacterium]|nr:MAG: hypothetical protein EP350_01725 [Alphaproteobacteria bacterium]